MEKRYRAPKGGGELEPDRKRLRRELGPEDLDEEPVEAEYYVEQYLVGWIIGRGGSTLKEIEADFHVKVVVDQSSKELGYSMVRISGSAEKVDAASGHINESLARASMNTSDGATVVGPFLLDGPPGVGSDPMYEEMTVEQCFVGWLLGKSGGVVREIEKDSGCKISINQETRTRGYSTVQLHGGEVQRMNARSQIQASLERASSTPGGCGPSNSERHDGYAEQSLQIEQRWVGWLLGKGGGMTKEIEEETGAVIKIDQLTKHLGYSIVKISGEDVNVEAAQARISEALQKVGGTLTDRAADSAPGKGRRLALASGAAARAGAGLGDPGRFASSAAPELGASATQVRIEQKWIGWVLGKGGTVLKEIEAASGAKVSLNQETKQQGYSIATVTGDPECVNSAIEHIREKLNQVNADGESLTAISSTGGAGRKDKAADDVVKKLTGLVDVIRAGAANGTGAHVLAQAAATVVQALVPTIRSGSATQRGAPVVQGVVTSIGSGRPPPSAPLRQPVATGSISGARVSTSARAGLANTPPNSSSSTSLELQVEQRWVGWLLGSSGKNIREMEAETGAKISIDQSTKEGGYSIVKIGGREGSVLHAESRIRSSLALKAPDGSAILEDPQARVLLETQQEDGDGIGQGPGDLEVEQKYVGWLLGKGGIVLKEIESQSGARVSIDQSTKDLGFSTVHITGGFRESTAARRLIQDKIQQANPSGPMAR